MPRPRTVTTPLDLTKLLGGRTRTRHELDATSYAVELAEEEGVIVRAGKQANATLWKLTSKGSRRAKAQK